MARSDKAGEKAVKLAKVRKTHPDSFGARFGLLVYRCRIEQNLSQRELAIKLFDDEARKSDIADLENGYIRKPQAKTIALYAETLDIPTEDIDACHTPPPASGGYTREEHEARLDKKEATLRADLERAGVDRGRLEAQLSEVRRRHADIETDYQKALADLAEARKTLDRYDNSLDREKTAAARRALDRGDRTLAEALFAEAKSALLAKAQDFNREAAALAFQQAQMADEDIRWQDAERLYTEAATLAATDVRYWIECSRVRMKLGIFPAALTAIRMARALAEEQGEERYFWAAGDYLGTLLMVEGRPDEAETLFREGLKTARTRANTLDTPESHRDLSVSLNRVGNIFHTRGNLDDAASAYAEYLTVSRQLAVRLDTPESHRDLSVSLNKVGNISHARGDFDDAASAYVESLTVRRQLAARLDTPESHRDLSVSLNKVGDVSHARGDLDDAASAYVESLTVSRQLAVRLDTPESHRDLSISLEKVGNISRARGDFDDAASAYDESLTARRQLAARLDTLESRRDLAVSLYKTTFIALDTQDLPTARTRHAEALALIPTLHPLHIEEMRTAFAELTPRLQDDPASPTSPP